LFALWANIHGGFVYGLAVLWLWALGTWLERAWEQREFMPGEKSLSLGRAALFSSAAALVFVRRGSGNDELIARTEYRTFRADDYLFVHRLVLDGAVRLGDVQAEIRRNISRWGPHPAAKFFRDFFGAG